MSTGTVSAIDSVGSLRSFAGSISAPYTFEVQGSSVPGDGGGGTYVYVASDTTSPDNGGTIIVDGAARRWHLLYSLPLNVATFGVANTGADVAALTESAIASLYGTYGGGSLSFSPSQTGYGFGRPDPGSLYGVEILPSIDLYGNRSTINLLNNSSFFTCTRKQDRGDTTFTSFYGHPGAIGTVAYVTVNSGGSGYSSPVVSDGVGGSYTAYVVGGVITVIEVNSSAIGLSVAPSLTITDSSGTGASATAVLGSSSAPDAAQILGNTTASQTAIQVTIGQEAAFSPGDLVYIRLGQAAYDAAEADYFLYAFVISTSPGTVNIDRQLSYAMTASTVANNRQRRMILMTEIPDGFVIDGFNFYNPATGSSNCEEAILMRYSRNAVVRNCAATNPGAGLVFAHFVDNFSAFGCYVRGSVSQGQASKGRCWNFAECKNVLVQGGGGENFQNTYAFVEGGCMNVVFRDQHIINNYPGRSSSTSEAIFSLNGGRDLTIENCVIEGNPGCIVNASSNANEITPILKSVQVKESFSPAFNAVQQWFNVLDVASDVQMGSWFHFGEKRKFSASYELGNNVSTGHSYLLMPSGVWTKITITLSSLTGVTAIWFSDSSLVYSVPNPNTAAVSSMSANIPFQFPQTSTYAFWSFGSNHPFSNPSLAKQLNYTTTNSVLPGTYLTVDIEYFPNASATTLGDVIPGGTYPLAFTGSVAFSPSVSSGAQISTNVTVTGALLGDSVAEISFSQSLAGVVLSAYVSAPNTVTCVFSNNSGSSYSPGSGTLRVKVARS